jgi:hypothetical protein
VSETKRPACHYDRALDLPLWAGDGSALGAHCHGWLEGYTLTGRHGWFATYEAFPMVSASQTVQHGK